MSIDELVVVADHLIRIPHPEFEGGTEPYATLEELAVMLKGHKGTPGIQKAREALILARVGSDSPPETKLRLACGYAGLEEPQLNVKVPRDVRREEDYARAGWKEARIMKDHMANDATEPVRKIRNALHDRGWRPSPRRPPDL